jgi:hypothetical protein
MPCHLTAIYANGDYAIENADGEIIDDSHPIWTPELTVDDGAGSLFPALFRAGHAHQVLTLDVELGFDYAGLGVHLFGILDGQVIFHSDSSGGVTGPWIAQVHAVFDVGALARVAGDIAWYVQADGGGGQQPVATARLELTWIYGEPAALFDNVSQLRLLRRVFSGIKTDAGPDQVVAGVADLCYFGFNKTYDVTFGASHYGCGRFGGMFELADYLEHYAQPRPVNCYDQAGIAQTLLGSLGVPSAWKYMEPFGYLGTADLIGVGPCNNPFYGSNGSAPVVEPDDPQRSAFSRRAFLASGAATIDACAGPHDGGESLAAYLASAIDTRTTLSKPGNTGKAADVTTQAGIGSLAFAPGATEDPPLPSGMQQILGAQDQLLSRLAGFATSVDWNRLIGQICVGHRLTMLRRSIMPSVDGAFSRWTVDSAEGPAVIRVFKAHGAHVALAREIDYLASFQRAPASFLSHRAELGAAGLVSDDAKLAMFVHHNVFVMVAGELPHALDIARDIFDALGAAPPSERRIVHSHEAFALRLGERRTLSTAMKIYHSLSGTAVRVVARRLYEFDIRAQQPGISRLRLAQVSEQTLDMDLHQVRIEVLA